MDGTSAISAISSVLTSTVKIAEKVFEICAVDTQAKAVLQTVNQVSSQLRDARILLRQKSALFTPLEKSMFEGTFRHTEQAITEIASLAERARADLEVTGPRIRMSTRILFVLRDSPNIHVSLTKLSIASQSLNAAITVLMGRQSHAMGLVHDEIKPRPSMNDLRPPPTYNESMFLSAQRRTNLRRRASAMSVGERSYSSSPMEPYIPDLKSALFLNESQANFRNDPRGDDKIHDTVETFDDVDFDSFSQVSCFSPSVTPSPSIRLRSRSEAPPSPLRELATEAFPQISICPPDIAYEMPGTDALGHSMQAAELIPPSNLPVLPRTRSNPTIHPPQGYRPWESRTALQPDELWMHVPAPIRTKHNDSEESQVLFSPGPDTRWDDCNAPFIPLRPAHTL